MIKKVIRMTVLTLILYSCRSEDVQYKTTFVNSSHLDSLYDEITVNGNEVGIIHIYSEYPDYNWVGDTDEGIACVDDAARAVIFYLREYTDSGVDEYLRKGEMLLKFILELQASNGYFNNFVWKDGSINTDFKTSIAQAGWWSWRALWALSESFQIVSDHDSFLSGRIEIALDKIIVNIKRDSDLTKVYKDIDGYRRPAWLPYGAASDQAALLVISLTEYLKNNEDTDIQKIIINLCEGILVMQEGDEDTFPYGAFLSWENTWHGWGNSQAYALLTAGEYFNNKEFIESALKEVKYFYPYLIHAGYYNEFTLSKNSKPEFIRFSQIAYEIRPMIFASLKAFELTNDSLYLRTATDLACWFLGNNISNRQVYFPESGICYDGINSSSELNKNSGAESTVEALLALQQVEHHETILLVMENYISTQ